MTPAPVSRKTSAPVVEIGLATCDSCGHGRSEHEFCSDLYPALCTHLYSDRIHESGWPDVCSCLEFEAGVVGSPETKETENDG